MTMNLSLKAVCLGLMLSSVGVLAQATPIDAQQSQIKATFKQMNVPVSGQFKTLSGDIQFDAKKPEAAKASVVVKTASFDLGDVNYNKEVAKPDWFDSQKYPDAVFTVTSIKPAAGGTFQGAGELTLRGIKKPLQFPVKVSSQGGKQVFTGQAKLKRLDFKVGASGDWGDTSLVADEVLIDFKLVSPEK
jgi:polyisoprenoid-binding protein YceI